MKDSHNELNERLAILRGDYLRDMPEKFSQIDLLMRRILARPNDHEALEGLLMAVHKLNGSAGSYGFHEAGCKAREVESELKSLLRGEVAYDDEWGKRLAKCIDDMKQMLPIGTVESAMRL